MSRRMIIDPVTRIEGHLRIEVELDGNDTVRDAWSSVTLWRGIETILKGRDPRDAPLMVQRFCGVCTYSHYEAGVLACEDAFGVTPPPNARLVRNLMKASQFMTDHIMHFYHLHGLDWADVESALRADPKKAERIAGGFHDNPYNSSEARYRSVQERLRGFMGSGRPGIFANAYWGNPSYKLSPEENLIVVSHYLDSLEISRKGAQMMAIFGGKNPHPQSLVVGGVTSVMDVLDAHRIAEYLYRLREVKTFVETAYLPDVIMAAQAYQGEALAGDGAGVKNYLCYGGFPLDDGWNRTLLPRGVVRSGDVDHPEELDEDLITESVAHSWYQGSEGLHPSMGETRPQYTGFDENGQIRGDGKYSWCKAPAYDGRPFEVGPLARFVVGYARGHPEIARLTDSFLETTGLPRRALFSTLGRTAARALETKLVADRTEGWVDELIANVKAGDTRTWSRSRVPEEAQGRGMSEVPRGALGHWITIENKVIANYQAVVPSTWNSAPRGDNGMRGPYEESLIGLRLANPEQPLEILRTIHSFDPCMACAVHILKPGRKDVGRFRVV